MPRMPESGGWARRTRIIIGKAFVAGLGQANGHLETLPSVGVQAPGVDAPGDVDLVDSAHESKPELVIVFAGVTPDCDACAYRSRSWVTTLSSRDRTALGHFSCADRSHALVTIASCSTPSRRHSV